MINNNPNRLLAVSTFNPDDPFGFGDDTELDALLDAQDEALPAEVGEVLEHLALYHDEGARYEGVSHTCPLVNDVAGTVF